MTRRYRPPSEPELTRRDQDDLQKCDELIDLLGGLERGPRRSIRGGIGAAPSLALAPPRSPIPDRRAAAEFIRR
jgi:hypothetical protein